MASAERATAVGAVSQATFVNSTALGAGAQTTRVNQIALGTAANTYTAAGITSAASTAAQGAVVGVITTDAAGNLASDGGALQNQINQGQKAIEGNVEGIAMAFALNTPYVPADKKYALNVNFGAFKHKTAFASSFGVRVSPNTQFDAGMTVGLDSGEVGGRVGLSFSW